MKQGGMVVIEDMGSINGTFINGRRLDPYLPEVIKDGDIVHLGKLQLEVKIKRR
jgi:pSer/pThr/pTyr-binding forkhead associated (FHA) protein